MKKIIFYLIIITVSILTINCKKEGSYFPDNSSVKTDTSSVYSFTSLEAIPTTIHIGDIVNIYATATGKGIAYTWSSSHAEIFGSGSHIQSSAQPCCLGRQKIGCTVSDGVHTITKSVVFNVIN